MPRGDVEFLDDHARMRGLTSRSTAVQRAVAMLRVADLTADYRDAFEGWKADGGAEAWDLTVGDGLE